MRSTDLLPIAGPITSHAMKSLLYC